MPRSPLAVPEHPQLPPEVRQAYVDVDRKLGVFIIPQLRQMGKAEDVELLVATGVNLAHRAADGDHQGLEASYRELLAEAQQALRRARTEEVRVAEAEGSRRRAASDLSSHLQNARTRLPVRRMARLEESLAELGDGEDTLDARQRVITAAIDEWERLSQSRQTREADRLAATAHLPVRPKTRETSRSRRARRDQERLLSMSEFLGSAGAENDRRTENGKDRAAAQ